MLSRSLSWFVSLPLFVCNAISPHQTSFTDFYIHSKLNEKRHCRCGMGLWNTLTMTIRVDRRIYCKGYISRLLITIQ